MHRSPHHPGRLTLCLLSMFATLFAFAGSAHADQAGTSPVKIFIMAGQSNMVGKGAISPVTTPGTLDYVVANDPAGKYQFLKSGGSYVVRDDVWIRDEDANAGGLEPGYGANSSSIGPELGFGNMMGDLNEQQIFIVKCAWGGKDLAFNFCPPGSRVGEPEPLVATDKGFYYAEILRLVNEATTNLATYFPDYIGGGYEIAGFCWHQGWNDRIDTAKSAAYETNMANFINDMRSDLAVSNMPFVIATTCLDGWNTYTQVERAQLAMADATAHPAFAGNVKVIDTRAGYQDLDFWQSPDDSPKNEGYHWNWNAKTHLHIGEAMADAMSLMVPARCPYRLQASGDATGVTLDWQNGTDALTSVQVIRDSATLDAAAAVSPSTFLDATAEPGLLEYQLVFTKSGDPCPPLTLTFDAGITGLEAFRTQTNVKLTWTNNLGYDAIELRRDGVLIEAALAGNATSYLDTAPPVSGTVTYSVVPTNGSAAATEVQINLGGASPGDALVYEPFEDADLSLDSNAAGAGLDGTWSAGAQSIAAGSLSYGALPTAGNSSYNGAGNAQSTGVIIRPELGAAGLLDHGAVLWFSFLANNPAGINTSFQFTIGTDKVGVFSGIADGGQGIGLNISRGESPQATTWSPAGSSGAFTGTNIPSDTTALVVGKITWGGDASSNDTVEVYLPDTALNMGSPVSTASAVLDQSQFDTIAFSGKNVTSPGIDEIRVGATYDSVIGGGVAPDETPPNPSPMTWATPPAATGDSSITMTATTATDPSGVEYFFHETSGNPGGSDSVWQDSPTYTDTGLNPETTYSYTVTARDKSSNQNPTDPSAPAASAITDAADVTAPPTPGFATPPTATSPTEITMTATVVTDPSGVEYEFIETSGNPGGSDSGWQESPIYNDTGLSPSTTYSYTVTARDKAAVPNVGTPSAAESATTQDPPSGPGGAVIYEPFADSDSTLTGNAPGTGLSGTWNASTSMGVSATSLSFGNLPVAGSKVDWNGQGGGSVSPGTSLFDAGLMADGATLWFSLLWNSAATGTNNDAAFALGTDDLARSKNNSTPMGTTGGGNGIGVELGNSSLVAAATWSGGTRARGATSGGLSQQVVLVVGKITWGVGGASADTVEIYLPGTDLALPASAVSTTTAMLDQAAFDTITFATKAISGEAIDEIRFGASYESVIGAGVAGNDYDTWAGDPGELFLGTLTDPSPDLDFDGGGLSTGIEWVVGGDPTDASDDASVAPVLDNTTDPDFLIFTYRRSDAANADGNTAIEVEYGTDLGGWATAVAGADILINATDEGADVGVDLVEVKIRRSAFAVGGKLFARLNVAVTP